MGNTVQYCNRLTASAIISVLESVGFVMECVDVELCDLSRAEVHRDYQAQSDEDLKAVRLNIKARKGSVMYQRSGSDRKQTVCCPIASLPGSHVGRSLEGTRSPLTYAQPVQDNRIIGSPSARKLEWPVAWKRQGSFRTDDP